MSEASELHRVGVSGHQDLPRAAIELLLARLDSWFKDGQGTTVISSLARGADTIVAETLLDRGATLHAIIPSRQYEATFTTSDARARYERLLNRAEIVEVLPFAVPSERAYMAAGTRVAHECEWLIAVWDGLQARGLGGTADVVALMGRLGKEVRVVWPTGLQR